MTLTDTDNGRRITVRVGDVVSVHLHENPASGYRWRISSNDEKVLAVNDDGFRADSPGVGSGGIAIWTFTARRRATSRLEFTKSRSWEPESSIERFSVDLTIVV